MKKAGKANVKMDPVSKEKMKKGNANTSSVDKSKTKTQKAIDMLSKMKPIGKRGMDGMNKGESMLMDMKPTPFSRKKK